MSDLISRQSAIDVLMFGEEMLRRVLDDMDVVGVERNKYEWGLGLIESEIEDMKELPSAEPEQWWIPIEERPPRLGENVLVSYWDGVFVDWLTQSEGNAYFFISGVAIQDIDAWMPLPEPYRADMRGEEE